MRKIPFFLYNFKEEDLQGIAETILEYSVIGKKQDNIAKIADSVEILEKRATEVTGIKNAIAVSSEISALLVALQALGIKRNHRVICSVYCHPYVPQCIRYFDAEPLFVDIDPSTLAMLPEKCEQLLVNKDSERIKAVIVSHIGGTLANMKPFYEMKEKYQVGLIEDGSYAIGLRDEEGRSIGADPRADFVVTSHFLGQKSKLFRAGMIFTNDDELAKKCFTLRYHSKVREASNNGLFYDIVDMSLDHTMTTTSSKMALCLANNLEENKKRRIEIAKMYREGLSGVDGVRLPEDFSTNIYTLFIIRLTKSRDKISAMLNEAGIETALHFIPANLLSYYKHKFSLKALQFPNALKIYQEVLSLPIYAGMSDEDVEYVIETLKAILKKELE